MWFLIVSSLAIISLLAYYLQRWYRRPYIDGFQSKAVFITGTDTGFGYELAVNLAKHGVKVYAGCFTVEGAEKLRNATNDGVTTVSLDITNAESVNKAKEIIEEDLKRAEKKLWGLVNNAGIFCGFNLGISSEEDYRRSMEVNFFGTMRVTETFLPLIKKSAGRIAFITSIAARISGSFEPYLCSKHALEPYCNGIRRWMKRYKVHAAIIEPGAFKSTQLFNNFTLEDSLDKTIAKLPDSLKEEYGEKFLQKMKSVLLATLRNPPYSSWNRTSMVINSVKHALFAQRPKARYVCGWDATFIFRLEPYFLDFINDFIVSIYLPFYKMRNHGISQ